MNVLRFAVILAVMFTLLFVVNAFVFAQEAVTPVESPEPVDDAFPLDLDMLATALKTIAFAGGAGGLAYYVMKYIGPEFAKSGWNDFAIRIVSLALTAIIAWVAWFCLIWLISLSVPVSAQGWVNKLFAIAVTSWSANQLIHGLGQKRSEHGGLT